MGDLTNDQLGSLAAAAWRCRQNAYILDDTKVGAAVMTSTGLTFTGCNIEQQFRSHDVHAEVNAISSMVAAGHIDLVAVVIVAERERFTPCGACMDWIHQFGGASCIVGYQATEKGEIRLFRAIELMPYYPV